MVKKLHDHNGKLIKPINGKNVRISTKIYDEIREFTIQKGYRFGWFFEQAALERKKVELKKSR